MRLRKSLFAILVVSLFGTTQANARSVKVSSHSLRDAVVAAKKHLGELDSSQSKIFDEEVMSRFQSFIRDYRSDPQGVQVEVDLGSVTDFLAFHAKKDTQPKVALTLAPELGCKKCVKALESVRRRVTKRLELRGFTVEELTARKLGAQNSSTIENRMIVYIRNQKYIAGLVLRWDQLEYGACNSWA